MLGNAHEQTEYQDFLISESRKGLISPDLYDTLIPSLEDDGVILDIGCGLGYTSAYYSEKFKGTGTFHIFACDYQVEILDLFWKRIVENNFQNITPFFMPNRSRLHFPEWIPKANHIFFSLSLSTTESQVDILNSIKAKMHDDCLLHIIDWDKGKNNNLLDEFIKPEQKLTEDSIEYSLEKSNFTIVKQYKISGPFFCITAKMNKTEETDEPISEETDENNTQS